MKNNATSDIVLRIAEATAGQAIRDDAIVGSQVRRHNWSKQLSSAINAQLEVSLMPGEIDALKLTELSNLVESQLKRDPKGQSLVDIYSKLRLVVRDAIDHETSYDWFSSWEGDILNESDSLERAEIVIRMEEEFGFSIPNEHAQAMMTVGQTVRYLWGRGCEQTFRLRNARDDVCQKAHIFYELRRLLSASGRIPPKNIRLDTRIAELIPTWHQQLADQVQRLFDLDPTKSSFSINIRKTSVKDLVNLISNNIKQPSK
jgi:hypothetical protein